MMYVTSWEKNSVSKYANDFAKGVVEDWYASSEWYYRHDPNFMRKHKIYNHCCYLIREVLKTLPSDISLPQAMRDGGMTIDWLRESLADGGVPREIIPNDAWLEMIIYTVIPCFLQRKKGYVVNIDLDESHEPKIYNRPNDPVGDYSLLAGEACKFSRDFKGWKLYKAIYVQCTYVRSEFYLQDNTYDYTCYKNAYRAYNPVNNEVLKAWNLAGIRNEVNAYIRGE